MVVPTIRPTATPALTPSPTATPVAATPSPGPVASNSLYLGDIEQGAVLIYSASANGPVSPSAIIAGSSTVFTDSSGSSPIYGVAVDGAGTVYVLTQTENAQQTTALSESILVFPSGETGNVAPARTIVLPTTIDAESLAYTNGSLYVTDDAGTGAVDVYASSAGGATMPLRTFSASGGFADPPLKVSIDGKGDAFVATYDITATAANEALQAIDEFSPAASGAVTPASTLTGANTRLGDGVLDAAVVDASADVDAVLDDATNDETTDIREFAAGASGNSAPTLAFTNANSDGPVDGAVGPDKSLYVSGISNGSPYAKIDVFAPGVSSPKRIIEAYESALPLIAIGPYVPTNSSGSMTLPLQHRNLRAMTLHDVLHRHRAFRNRRR